MEESIYGTYKESMEKIMQTLVEELEKKNNLIFQETGEKGYEHITARLKFDQSMRKKLLARKLPIDTYHALRSLRDSIGLRIICSFRDDVYKMVDELKQMPEVEVIEEKDYIKKAKENGYRSYHMILEMTVPYEDVDGNLPGKYYVEIQLRTIAMDTWAELEHKIRYKKDVANREVIASELKRCADELASCDLSMQTIRDLIR
ncbi:MAG: GTP pyrophosphokinase family protein [Lachnospiraceae bacterium]|nr:GTP pyrophosphokinase family protein [Lachnospiraceae bacterium]